MLEERYIVFKKSDVAELAPAAQAQLQRLAVATNYVREKRGAEPIKALVVEADWPEYEPTKKAILRRADGVIRPDWHVFGQVVLGAVMALAAGRAIYEVFLK